MANPLDSAAFVRLLVADLKEVTGPEAFKELPSMIPTIYRMLDSDSAWEEFYAVGNVPDIPKFNGKITYLSVYPGFHTKIEPGEFGGGLQWERKFLDDNKYQVLVNDAKGLLRAAHRVREKYGVKTFTNAFSSAFDFMESEEGVSLCSSSHTTKSGTSTSVGFDNSGTTAFSKTAVAATRVLMRKFRDDISERYEISDNLGLIVPDNLADEAYEIVGTPKGYDTVGEDKNMDYGRYKVIPYLRMDDSDTNNWFMVDLDAMKRDLVWIERVAPESATNIDFQTKIVQQSMYFRIGYGFKNWRWAYGHAVT